MSTTISNGSVTLSPILLMDYRSSRQSAHAVHRILGTNSVAVTLREGARPSGAFRMLVAGHTEAVAMQNLHSGATVLTFAESDVAGLSRKYVTTGSVEISPDDRTSNWWVDVSYQEVPG